MLRFIIIVIPLLLIPASLIAQFGKGKVIDSSMKSSGITHIKMADINGDSFPDLVASFSYTDKIAWYENLKGYGFSVQKMVTSKVQYAVYVDVADFNGDGRLDILSTSKQDFKIAWYANTGTGFGSQIIIDSMLYSPEKAQAVDVELDGDMDIFAIEDTAALLYRNDGKGNFPVKEVISHNSEYYEMNHADLNGDDYPDLLLGTAHGLQVYLNDSAGSFTRYTDLISNTLSFLAYPADLDGDGDVDVVTRRHLTARMELKWYENDGSANFTLKQVITDRALNVESITAVDVDGDQDLDLVTAFDQSGEVLWIENMDTGNFDSMRIIFGMNDYLINQVASGDINRDGLPDVIWSAPAGPVMYHLQVPGIPSSINRKTPGRFRIYPNPASGQFWVELNKPGVYDVVDPSGKVIRSLGHLQKGRYVIPVGSMPKGVYFIRSTCMNTVSVQKLLIY